MQNQWLVKIEERQEGILKDMKIVLFNIAQNQSFVQIGAGKTQQSLYQRPLLHTSRLYASSTLLYVIYYLLLITFIIIYYTDIFTRS